VVQALRLRLRRLTLLRLRALVLQQSLSVMLEQPALQKLPVLSQLLELLELLELLLVDQMRLMRLALLKLELRMLWVVFGDAASFGNGIAYSGGRISEFVVWEGKHYKMREPRWHLLIHLTFAFGGKCFPP
jgi:hypothetical protein